MSDTNRARTNGERMELFSIYPSINKKLTEVNNLPDDRKLCFECLLRLLDNKASEGDRIAASVLLDEHLCGNYEWLRACVAARPVSKHADFTGALNVCGYNGAPWAKELISALEEMQQS